MEAGHVIVTNACNLECSNCTQMVGHYKKPYFMDTETVRRAILSLVTPYTTISQEFPEGFPGVIGIFGGEPTVHPQFAEICKLVQELIPNRRKRGLWTDGYRLERYRSIIDDTWDPDLVLLNRHEDETGRHQPLLIASDEVVDDKVLMWKLIHNCWIQERWSFGCTPKGGFFCEHAAAMDMLFDGPGGYPLEPGWWAKEANQFLDQVERSCTRCSAAIPMPAVRASEQFDIVSAGNLELLRKAGSPRVRDGKVVVFNQKISREEIEKMLRTGWSPWRHDPQTNLLDKDEDFNTYNPPLFEKVGDLVQITLTE